MGDIEGSHRRQPNLLAPSMNGHVPAAAPVRVVDAFVVILDLSKALRAGSDQIEST